MIKNLKQFIPQTKDAIGLCTVTTITLSLFIAGLCDVLDYLIVKGILFLSFGTLFVFAIVYAFKNDAKKNRPEDLPQDDSN